MPTSVAVSAEVAKGRVGSNDLAQMTRGESEVLNP